MSIAAMLIALLVLIALGLVVRDIAREREHIRAALRGPPPWPTDDELLRQAREEHKMREKFDSECG